MAMDNVDIEKLIAQEMERDAKRKEYNERPEVKEKRKKYNQKRQEESKIARAVMNGQMSHEDGQAAIEALKAS